MSHLRKVRVLINPKSGVGFTRELIQKALYAVWDVKGIDLSFQYSRSAEDGCEKTVRAIQEEVDTILVVGGDGMVNSIGSTLVGSDVALGVIPAGSGNGFTRHFGIPILPARAVRSLFDAKRQRIDVGTANGRPFFVTCSMAWDAALVRTFEKSPVRGVLPYVFASVYEFFEYRPQPFLVTRDDEDQVEYKDPMIFTVANLTQFGGGAKIAPQACPDDGVLELVVIARKDMHKILPNIPRLFAGTLDTLPEVETCSFKKLKVNRERPVPIQLDGELVEAGPEVEIGVLPKALTVLVPKAEGS